jgi:hypothetical protein
MTTTTCSSRDDNEAIRTPKSTRVSSAGDMTNPSRMFGFGKTKPRMGPEIWSTVTDLDLGNLGHHKIQQKAGLTWVEGPLMDS